MFGRGYIFQTELSYTQYNNRNTLNTLKPRIMNGSIQPAKLGQKSFTRSFFLIFQHLEAF